jgi:hypothetical protein
MSSQAQSIQLLLKSFPARPFDQKALDKKVSQEVNKFHNKSSQENIRSQWELVLKNEIFTFAVRPLSQLEMVILIAHHLYRQRRDQP